jgi:hypothetical protein
MNYIKIKLSKRDVESIEDNLQLALNGCALLRERSGVSEKYSLNILIMNATKTLNMFRKRVKNGIKEKVPYKRTETYKK